MTSSDALRAPHMRPLPSAAAGGKTSLSLLLEGATMMLSIVLVWALSAQFVAPGWSILSLVNFIWFCLFLFRVAPAAIAVALPYIITKSSTVVALVLIEFGAEIPELGMVGTPGIHTASFVFYVAVLFGAYALAFSAVYRRMEMARPGFLTRFFDAWANPIVIAILIFVTLIALALIARGLISGFPLLAGIDRFVYRRFAADKIVLYALNFKFIIAYMLGFAVFCAPAARLLKLGAAGLGLLMMLLYFLFGDKFFTQLAAMSAFFAPYLLINHEKVRRNILVFGIGGLLAFSAVFSVTWWIYSQGGASTNAATMQRLSGRIVGQGELWYIQSLVGAPLVNWDRHLVETNLQALKVKEMEPFAQRESIGPAYFSNKYAPDFLRASLNRNFGTVTYTMAAEPLGLVAFGWIGLAILLILCGLVIAAGHLLIARAIVKRLPISIIFGAFILIQTQVMLNQGAPWVMFSIFNLKWLGVIAAIELGLIVLGASQRPPRPGLRRSPQRR